MRRREFFAIVGGAVLATWPAMGQQDRIRVIGMLTPFSKQVENFLDPFLSRMKTLGWEEGRNFRLNFLWAEGENKSLPALVEELLASHPAVIVAAGDPAITAVQRGAARVPIVGITDDMAGSRLIASMPRPGGNTTGISILASELDVKRLELLHALVPRAERIGILADPSTISTRAALDEAAAGLHLQLVSLNATDRGGVERALDALASAGVDAVNVLASPILFAHHHLMIERLNGAGLPAIFQWPERAAAGALAGYGPSFVRTFSQLTPIVDKVLRGAKPADIPVEQPTKFELAINLKTAKTLGLTIPPSILARADEVIE